MNSNWKE
jgi:hypothetical protein